MILLSGFLHDRTTCQFASNIMTRQYRYFDFFITFIFQLVAFRAIVAGNSLLAIIQAQAATLIFTTRSGESKGDC